MRYGRPAAVRPVRLPAQRVRAGSARAALPVPYASAAARTVIADRTAAGMLYYLWYGLPAAGIRRRFVRMDKET
ncbi:hypothetical protein CXIVA_13550 [Clostridium sp. SY8519]|nr:hypothetical protein CXIVA_13550 [Clostridium sp. SY8519]